MARARPALAAVLAALLVLSASPVAAHGNHVEADSQRSADGTVVVEAVRPLSEGFIVLHRATGTDDPGTPIGVTPVDARFQQGVRVQINESVWADWQGARTVWVTFHGNRGDPGFDPDEDPIVSPFGTVQGFKITVEKAGHAAVVVAERSRPQRTSTATARIANATIGTRGYVVLRAGSSGDGRVVGVHPITPGTHENVTVGFDASAFPENQSTVGLTAQLYAETTGDGEFSPSDHPITAGNDTVSTYFLVQRTASDDGDTGVDVRTPTETDESVVTPTTTTRSPTTEPESSGNTPGFGVLHVAVAALVAAFLFRRRN